MVSPMTLAALLPLLVAANGHMIMKTPIPYGRGVISNSPLDGSGSDFPCKNIFDLTDPVADVNHMAIGEPQTLSFTGTAVHGGGSCQVSLTTDLKPTKQSKWMVIKSIEGGCPANAPGNLESNDATTFQYTVPAGIAPGQYTIAWTWVNKIGNREFYMNCGRADITAAKKKRYAVAPKTDLLKRADLPDLFVANIDGVSNGCKTEEGFDIQYPNPGADVQKAADGKFEDISALGCTGASAGTGASSGNGSSASPASSGSSGSTATTPSATSAVPGVFASGAAPAGTSTTATTTAAAAAATTTSAAAVAQSTPITPASNTTGGATASSGTCTEGNWMCAKDGTSFQRCASGAWSVPIPMAAGTSCTAGQSTNLDMKVVGRRSIARRRALPSSEKSG